jgi:hypothetical protein
LVKVESLYSTMITNRGRWPATAPVAELPRLYRAMISPNGHAARRVVLFMVPPIT